MSKYGVSFGNMATPASQAYRTGIKIFTITKVPVEVVELAMYGAGSVAPADIQHEATLTALSAAGPGTGQTTQTPETFGPNKLVASTSTCSVTYVTTEPTTYAAVSPVLFSFNQRGGMRWAVPRGEGMGNVFENTNMHLGARVRSSGAGNVDGNLHFWE